AGAVKELIEVCHRHDVLVSTGGFIEYVLTQGPEAVRLYLQACRELGFDIVEVSSGFVAVPGDALVRLGGKGAGGGVKGKPGGGARRRERGGGGGPAAPGGAPRGGPPLPGGGGPPDHDRVGGGHGERPALAARRAGEDHRRPGAGAGDVRGGRPAGV